FAWRKLKAEVFKQQLDTELQIFGYDISESNLDIARDNITQLRMHKDIRLAPADFLQLTPPVERGMVMINPPYGERLRKVNVSELYKNIGNTLKHRFSGFEAWIISSDLDAMKNIGLKPYRKYTLYNGKLECRLHAFRMF
ncbi:MAG: RNA methyltransferase, partial [Bacteroidales bacterium]